MKVQKNAKPYKAVQSRGPAAQPPRLALRRVVSLLAAGSLLMPSAFAAGTTRTWTGNKMTNWSAMDGFDGVPATGDLLVFGASGTQGTALNNDFSTGMTFASMTFNPGASAYTITNPNTYLSSPTYVTSFTTGVANNSGVLQVLNMDIGLQNGAVLAGSNFELTAGHNILSNQASGSATISATGLILDSGSSLGVFSGRTLTQTAASTITAGQLTKTSLGTLILGGVNSYAGGTNVTAGTLRITGAGTLGAATGALTVGAVNFSPAVLDLNGTNQTVDGVSGSNSNTAGSSSGFVNTITNSNATASTLTIGSNNGGGTYNGGINGKLAIVKNGTGTETFTVTGTGNVGANATNYSGGTTVNGGTLVLGSAAADGTGTLTVNTGGTVTVTANNALGAGQAALAGGALRNAFVPTTGKSTQTTGQLSLKTGTASTLDFGALPRTAGAVFTFSGFDTVNTGTLSVTDWLGTPIVGGGLDQLFISTALTGSQLSQITFNVGGVNFAATQLGTGEIVAVAAPEPSQYAAFALGLLGLGGLALRARRRVTA